VRRHRDDDGAVLIMVLILVMLISVALGALLTMADISLRTTVNLRGQAATSADADGAMQAALNNIRNSQATADGHCFGSTDTLALPSFDGGTSASVACTADPSTVLIQCPSLSNCNRPGNAILTLGSIPGEDGVTISQPNTSSFQVHGSVYSASTINVAGGTLAASSGVYARQACSGKIQSTPEASCSSNAANPLGTDPQYSPAVSSVPAHQSLPACTSANSVIQFSPGYYDDASGLSDMMSGHSSCRGSTWWFRPGTYYFDFHNSGTNSNPLLSSGTGNVWTVNDGTLVAGTPVDARGARISRPAVPATIPGACANPINDASALGVQFIFGGNSQMLVKAGQSEICGSYSTTKPPVAVYGLTSGSESTASTTLPVGSVASTGDFGASATVANLGTANDGKFASWTSTTKNQSGSLTVGGFTPPSAIPAGSILKSATVRVIHKHSGASSDGLTVAVTLPGGTAQSVTLPGQTGGTAWQTEQTAVALDTAAGHLAASVYAGTFTGAQIAVTAGLTAANDTEFIDAVQLDLTYVPPALRAETGCVTAGPYTGGSSSSCAVITTTNSPGSQFYVQGTTYIPAAVVDLSLNNVAEQVFRFGVISRALRIKQTGSFAYTGPVIEVPDDAPGFAFAVYLSAYVCPDRTSCPATGRPALRAKAAIVDAMPAAPTAGQRRIAILSWDSSG